MEPVVDVTYVALRTLKVGGQPRNPGELVPEATTWHNIDAYIRSGRITAVPRASVDQAALEEAEAKHKERMDQAREANAPEEVLIEEHTAEELYEQAQEADVEGRSSMTKDELAEALVEEQEEEAPATEDGETNQPEETSEEPAAETEHAEAETESVEGETSDDEQPEAEPQTDDDLDRYHTGQGWYEVPGAEKKMRRDEALEFLTAPESDEE